MDAWAGSSLHLLATHCSQCTSERLLEPPLAVKRCRDMSAHTKDTLPTELIKNSPRGGTACPEAPSSTEGSRVRKAWASQRARRAGKKAETDSTNVQGRLNE